MKVATVSKNSYIVESLGLFTFKNRRLQSFPADMQLPEALYYSKQILLGLSELVRLKEVELKPFPAQALILEICGGGWTIQQTAAAMEYSRTLLEDGYVVVGNVKINLKTL